METRKEDGVDSVFLNLPARRSLYYGVVGFQDPYVDSKHKGIPYHIRNDGKTHHFLATHISPQKIKSQRDPIGGALRENKVKLYSIFTS
jgi:hypothetical protein